MGEKENFYTSNTPTLQHSNTPSFPGVSHFFNGLSQEQDIYKLISVPFYGIKIAHFRAEGEKVPTLCYNMKARRI